MSFLKEVNQIFIIFGCKCFILNNRKSNISKLDNIFLDYSLPTKACTVFHERTLIVRDSIYVIFYEWLDHKDKP